MEENNKKPILRGIKGAPGVTEGRVRKILTPYKEVKFEAGYVAVTEFTTPVLALSLKEAKAIVCEKGTTTSHAAVISREWGIPCLVSVKEAMTILQDEDFIIVDADEGVIYKR